MAKDAGAVKDDRVETETTSGAGGGGERKPELEAWDDVQAREVAAELTFIAGAVVVTSVATVPGWRELSAGWGNGPPHSTAVS